MNKREKEEIENGLHSVPMTIIMNLMKLKKQINFLLILNLILAIGFAISCYDSIAVRDRYWHEHTQEVVDIIHEHCEVERASWQD